jgi:RNA polymerase sigma-70 factor (ECF subfamily)
LNASSTASDSTSQGSAQRQSERWFLDEVHPHEAVLKAYLRKAYPTVPDADDIVQETFLRAWKARTVTPIRSAKAFVFQVARRIAIDLIRRRRTSPEEAVCDRTVSSVLDDGPSVADAVCRNEELWLLAQAVHALPTRCREVMILRKIEGLSQKEIAVRLGLAEGTVQIHIGRGLRHLEKFFADRGYR